MRRRAPIRPTRPHRIRLAFLLTGSACLFLLVTLACPGQQNLVQTNDSLTACAQDPIANTCDTGDFQRLSQSQTIQVTASDAHGHALATSITLTITGVNARTATVTTDSSGQGTYAYSGATAGTDAIAISLASGDSAHVSHPVVVHWVNTPGFIHPIIFLHGITEDAQVYARQQEWTGLFEALDLVYDPSYIQVFCYVDDKAWLSDPSACPSSNTQTCTTDCVSQSPVDDNALSLANAVNALYTQAGKPVTLLGYSMGAAISRTLLAGCPLAADSTPCDTARGRVDQAYFFNGVQQGSWLLHVKNTWDAANLTLADTHVPLGLNSPFAAVLPVIEQAIFAVVKAKLSGLDANSAAARDLAPGSVSITRRNQAAPSIPTNIKLYTFYGDIRVELGFTNLVYHLPGKQELPLGDLVLLAQNDPANDLPAWGGAALCDKCGAPDKLGYHNSGGGDRLSGQYHAWALYSPYSIDVSALAALLTNSNASQGFPILGSPVSHMNVVAPNVQSPGSPVQVEDITQPGQKTTDLPAEVLAILMVNDGIA